MKRAVYLLLVCFLSAVLPGCAENAPAYTGERSQSNMWKSDASDQQEEYPVEPYGVLEAGGYIEFEGLKLLYDGEYFSITSSREDTVAVSVSVIGVKKDGTHEFLQAPAFYGVDEAQYDEDIEENEWAVEHLTNQVRPNGTLLAAMDIFELDGYPKPDIDEDGYYDLIFNVIPIREDGSFSTGDLIESDVYRLKK